MPLTTYAELQDSIEEHLDRTDLTVTIPDFITIAESYHKRDVRIREMLNRDPITVNDRYINLPTGFLEAKSLRLLTSPVTVLTYVSPYEMTKRRTETVGKPHYFTSHATLEFDKDADQAYSGEILFYKAEDALSAVNTTNNILDRAPELYLYGALVASAPFLMHDERIPVWTALYQKAVDDVNTQDRRRIGPSFARPHGPTP